VISLIAAIKREVISDIVAVSFISGRNCRCPEKIQTFHNLLTNPNTVLTSKNRNLKNRLCHSPEILKTSIV
jgi:hypothetical protein